jgi:hypothetical protein
VNDEPISEADNLGYYAIGSVAMIGGLYFLTKKSEEKKNTDSFLLQ